LVGGSSGRHVSHWLLYWIGGVGRNDDFIWNQRCWSGGRWKTLDWFSGDLARSDLGRGESLSRFPGDWGFGRFGYTRAHKVIWIKLIEAPLSKRQWISTKLWTSLPRSDLQV